MRFFLDDFYPKCDHVRVVFMEMRGLDGSERWQKLWLKIVYGRFSSGCLFLFPIFTVLVEKEKEL